MKIYVATILQILFVFCFNTQIQLIPQPNSQQLQKLNLLRSLYRYRTRTISIDSQKYKCLTPVKELLSSKHSSTINKDSIPTIPINQHVNDDLFEKLDFLEDKEGIVHYTKQFLYKYRHKAIVSQYDDDTTKYVNQKKVYENFTMGIYPQQKIPIEKNTTSKQRRKLSQVKIQEGQSQQFEYDHQNSIIHTNTPIYSDIMDKMLYFEVTLRIRLSEIEMRSINPELKIIDKDKKIIQKVFNAIALSNYELQIIPKTSLKFQVLKILKIKSTQYSKKSVPIVDKLTIPKRGNIIFTPNTDRICGSDQNNGLKVHTSLLLTLKSTKSYKEYQTKLQQYLTKKININKADDTLQINIIQQPQLDLTENMAYMLVTIKQILGEYVYLLNHQLPHQWEIMGCSILQDGKKALAYHGLVDMLTNQNQLINSGISEAKQLQFDQKLYIDQSVQFKYIGQTILKISQAPQKFIEPGLQLSCITKAKIQSQQLNGTYALLVPITVGQSFDKDKKYYEFYPKSGPDGGFLDFMQYIQKDFVCFRYEQAGQEFLVNQQTSLEFNKTNQNQQFYKVSKGYNFDLQKLQSRTSQYEKIYILHLSESCILELEAQTQKAAKPNRFIMTLNKLFKIGYFPNNFTKYEQQQNSYYQNSTSKSPILITRNGIYRFDDYMKYPRLIINSNSLQYTQILKNIKVRYGYAFLRIIKIKKQQEVYKNFYAALADSYYSISSYNAFFRPQSSQATSTRFINGDYCGGKINKNREVLVKIRCGEPWFKIDFIKQVSPCSYEINLISQFLCQQRIIFASKPNVIVPFQGSVCVPEQVLLN